MHSLLRFLKRLCVGCGLSAVAFYTRCVQLLHRCVTVPLETTVKVSTDTRERLARLKYSKHFCTFEEVIVHLLKEHEEKESDDRTVSTVPA